MQSPIARVRVTEKNQDELPVLVKWIDFIDWFFTVSEKIPKNIRFTITQRIENYVLDILDLLIEARYSKNKLFFLRQINLKLEKLRIFLRICKQRKYITIKTYTHAAKTIDQVGRMIGGWIKQQASNGK